MHTKGPWHVLKYDGAVYITSAERAFDSWFISEVKPGAQDENGRDMTAGNAQLLAAAPELLEALWDLLRDEKMLDDDDPALVATRERARAAIARATGTQHESEAKP